MVFNEFDEPRPKVPLDRSKRPAERSRGERTHYTLDDSPSSAQLEHQEGIDFRMGDVADMGPASPKDSEFPRPVPDLRLGDADNRLDS